jgi:hypothetical protein
MRRESYDSWEKELLLSLVENIDGGLVIITSVRISRSSLLFNCRMVPGTCTGTRYGFSRELTLNFCLP